ncbi:MAG TPA: helicase-related protein [Candidatus Cloacimonas sp.]|nr:helicase-related protein [Candidatus Cloacimonas sp.]
MEQLQPDKSSNDNSGHYSIGSLVSVRGREWVVQPESTSELLIVKPLGGSEEEITGVLTAIEEVHPASFSLPDPTQLGDYQSCNLLRNALRLGFRNSAGPFRSFGRLAVNPRPYQLLPLLMALKLDPVRILIADDVGVGKTIEACLIARELLDRGEISRICVLTPPHIAEQWQSELLDKFHIDAELVLSSTVRQLEKNCAQNESVFEVYPFTVVSIDYIKSGRHKDEFIRTAPEMIIIDEAHTASYDNISTSSRQQRYELVNALSKDLSRHLILVTATPHSGNVNAFRSLLSLLNSEFAAYPDDLTGTENENYRKTIAKHFIQRRRADIEHYLEDTSFPEAIIEELSYKLSEPYRQLFSKALNYAREIVQDKEGGDLHRRIRWWSALSLLRALASSPAAAVKTMNNRNATQETDNPWEADELGRRQVYDTYDRDGTESSDIVPGSVSSEDQNSYSNRKLRALAKEAESLFGELDYKLLNIIKPLKTYLKEGFKPIIFCRFIQTADYLTEQLKQRLPQDVEIASVTGLVPPEGREQSIIELSKHEKRVLVCTDCLSEGINLQNYFDAVIHYDLSWNPTKHEQREGRVDRFGQTSKKVKLLTYYGTDNQIDGIILDVLLKKHHQIKSTLGVSVPVPYDSEKVLEAIFEGLLLREQESSSEQLIIPIFDDFFAQDKQKLHLAWDKAKEREKLSRSIFSQQALSKYLDEITTELDKINESIGSKLDIRNFVKQSLIRFNASIIEHEDTLQIDVSTVPNFVKESCYFPSAKLILKLELPVSENEMYLPRIHPIVEGLADIVINTALEGNSAIAKRCGVIRTSSVERKTTLLLMRYRFHLIEAFHNKSYPILVEDSQILAFQGKPEEPEWLEKQEISKLLESIPAVNVSPEFAKEQLEKVIADYNKLLPHLNIFAEERARELLSAHTKVRDLSLIGKSVKPQVKTQLPADLVGVYIYLPI